MAIDWDSIINTLYKHLAGPAKPAVGRSDPFGVLVSTVISLRTKDEVTGPASKRLIQRAGTPEKLCALDEIEIQKIIYPAGFYRNKAKNLKEIARILVERYGGRVPADMEELLALPGVGRKTANLVRNLGFGLPGICVDTHVHRISNRTGWVRTGNPYQTELALLKILPQKYFIPINSLLVRFGQNVCTPVSPHCSSCPLPFRCPRVGVTRSR